MSRARRGVTVIVPVYGNPEALRQALTSLAGELDPASDALLVLDDAGPDATLVREVALQAAVAFPALRFERLPRNVGFVGACNRGAELAPAGTDILLLNSDAELAPGCLAALHDAVHSDPRIGVASPRSDNATIASLPLRRLDPAAPPDRELTRAIAAHVTALLPAVSTVPVANGFCFYVRRELVDRHGLFDPAFSPGYGEENDFCLRMAEFGHRSVLVNGALAFHLRGQSFATADRVRLRAAHDALLVRRHPGFPGAVRDYLRGGMHPVDAFAEPLAAPTGMPRVLLDLELAPRPEDLAKLRELTASPAAVWTVRVPPSAIRRTRAGLPGVELLAEPPSTRVWDAGVALGAGADAQLARLTYAAPRVLERAGGDAAALAESARRPVDLDDLATRWALNGPRLAATRALDPRPPGLGRRVARRVRGILSGGARR